MASDPALDFLRASNVRPIGIFASYMATAASITVLIISILVRGTGNGGLRLTGRTPQLSLHVAIFSALAIGSLGMTWYHMFEYFVWSYKDWSGVNGLPLPETASEAVSSLFSESVRVLVDKDGYETLAPRVWLGSWLKDTQLFRQAWWMASITPRRWWWTSQIFIHSMVWSLRVGRQGPTRAIPYLWAFILLGQIVAISFAQNLFNLAVLLNRPLAAPPRASPAAQSRAIPLLGLIIILSQPVLFIPQVLASDKWFMPALLAPHVALFGLAYLPLTRRTVKSAMLFYYIFYPAVILGMTTMEVWGEGWDWSSGKDALLHALYEHPAVSSVGWDVVLCWVSAGLWEVIGV